ncbi:MAG: glycerate kinase [Mucilaginibacter sp.]|uniref:glycerate kinase n=1 Tax=Mucilaginibacter sp. TaxID=1882438 RepID=UPI002636DF5C|nr:glycerate kinase [Mucilaginibacter sp.]MDB5002823.1 glycerate kinase [Mucilaginibacter sp.]
MNILIAPNAFKNSLDAQSVAEAIALGLEQSNLNCQCQLFPVGDGGDGTGELLIKHLHGTIINANVHDALGREITASFGLVDNGRTAVIEMANASGIRLLKPTELNPMQANTTGTGELIKAALGKGVNKIIIGMGGSATVDGGIGILSVLGVRFLDAEGQELQPIPAKLEAMESVDLSGLDKLVLACEIVILCDVDNKLLGNEGAATVFGPQKGAAPHDVVKLDTMLSKLAAIALQQTGKDMTTIKHSGTAGGAAAGLYAFLNARLMSGANSFLELTGFNDALQNADLVITGEGAIDEQTLQGKAPGVVAGLAKKKNIKVIGLAGKVPLAPSAALNQYFDTLLSINKEPTDLPTALKHTRENLVYAAKEIGDSLVVN